MNIFDYFFSTLYVNIAKYILIATDTDGVRIIVKLFGIFFMGPTLSFFYRCVLKRLLPSFKFFYFNLIYYLNKMINSYNFLQFINN